MDSDFGLEQAKTEKDKIRAMLVVTSENADSREKAEPVREELEALCDTLGIHTAAWDYFNVRAFNSSTYLGSGQIQRLASKPEENYCNLVVFNNSISPRVQRNLEELLRTAVVDRQELILQIFADRAVTKEARLPVSYTHLTLPTNSRV